MTQVRIGKKLWALVRWMRKWQRTKVAGIYQLQQYNACKYTCEHRLATIDLAWSLWMELTASKFITFWFKSSFNRGIKTATRRRFQAQMLRLITSWLWWTLKSGWERPKKKKTPACYSSPCTRWRIPTLMDQFNDMKDILGKTNRKNPAMINRWNSSDMWHKKMKLQRWDTLDIY